MNGAEVGVEGKENWVPVLAIAAGTFSTVTTEFLPVGLLPQISRSLHTTLSHAAWMVTIPGLIAALAAPLLLVGVRESNRRSILLILTALTALSNLLSGMSHVFIMLLVARLLLGICVGGFWAFAANMGRQLVRLPSSHNRATAIILTGTSAGTICGLPAGTFIGNLTTWRTAFEINCLLALCVLVVQVWTLPSLPAEKSVKWSELVSPFRFHEVRIALSCTFLVIVGYFAGYTYLTPFLTLAFRVSAVTIPVLLFAYGAAGFLGTFTAERLLRKGPRRALVFVSLVLLGTMCFGAHLGRGLTRAMLFAILFGACFGALPMTLATWMFQATPETPEGGQVLSVITFQLAIAFGSAIGGAVVSRGGVLASMTAGSLAVFVAMLITKPWSSKPSAVREPATH